ncbi:phosphate ABC transporter substrate-binding protein [Bermanella marisrubri]|uniref:Phosphate ABC transporter substrate-binding protein n=1 Tax=Bermanella marisrubri TaxID=207949 RepID=Q1N6S2_9GAMM|nr:hypothetical protein [Bermanella marisrubri]EAT13520.1 hypothetical protein RED65_09019 [Oceanobacter sp. RED65] [Bermanella marisrubri]QIZ84320.1 phosphate ABC transporter substrate-binding protein [Bermanella marisrubri]
MKYFIALVILTSSFFASTVSAEVEVIVHPSNGAALDKDVVQRIYLGKTRAFPGGGEAVPITLPEGSPANADFTQNFLAKSPKQLKSYWAKMVFTGKGTPPREVASAAEMVKLIASNPSLIGFVPAGSADGSVKVVLKN